MEGIRSGDMVVGDSVSLQNKIAAIRAAGPSKLQVSFIIIIIIIIIIIV